MTDASKTLRKKRTTNSLWMMLLLIASATLYRYNPELLAMMSGQRPQEIADPGIEVLQRGVMAMFFLPWGIVYSSIMASFIENQLKPEAFGTLSRWGVIFCLSLLCFTLVVA